MSCFARIIPTLIFNLAQRIIHLWLIWLEVFIGYREVVSFRFFEVLSNLLGIKPCQTFRTRESAVVIVGADGDIGRSIAIRFSEVGYTVFAICPDRTHHASSTATRKTSDVSSNLLHSWHYKKESSPRLPWGLIAPISLDMSSKPERMRAYETVHTYCSHHSLQLVALISFPSSSVNDVAERPSTIQHFIQHLSQKFPPLCLAKDDVLRDIVAREVMEPILLTQDYIKMLGESSGKVILVSDCSESSLILGARFVEETRRTICKALRRELEPMGIRVSSIISSPMLNATLIGGRFEPIEFDMSNMCSKLTNANILTVLGQELKVQQTLGKMFNFFDIREEDLFLVTLRIVESRYPKSEHLIGVYPLVTSLLNASPLTVRWLVDVMGCSK